MSKDSKKSILYDELAEKYILATYISGKRILVEDVGLIPKPEWFFEYSHQEIFKSIEALESEGFEIDLLSLTKKLREEKKLEKIGGESYLLQILEETPIQSRVEHGIKTLRDLYLRRQVANIAKETVQEAHDESKNIADLFNSFEERITNNETIKFPTSISLLRNDLDDFIRSVHNPKEEEEEILCDYSKLNEILGGLRRNNLIILASRPGEGKTTLALNIAFQVAFKSMLPVAFFSLEMDKKQLLTRILASEGTKRGLDPRFKIEFPEIYESEETVRKAYMVHSAGTLTLDAIEQAQKKFKNKQKIFNNAKSIEQEQIRIGTLLSTNRFSDREHQLHISDSPNLTVGDIKIQCKRLAREKGKLGLVVIDYLQLLGSGQKYVNRYDEITSISRSLKILAKDLDCPVIAISQLSRGIDSREKGTITVSGKSFDVDPRPRLSDLRESGSIEQDADSVIFIYDQYRKRQMGDDNMTKSEIIEKRHNLEKGFAPVSLMVEKNRHGRTGKIDMVFLKASQFMQEQEWSKKTGETQHNI
ncbi:hypothetical protein CL643_04100 [bacterium]|nr:hypothetical protein [bacterium]